MVEDGSPAPEEEAVLAESVGLAMLVVLQTLTPAERLAFVLHDVFAVPFDEVAAVLPPGATLDTVPGPHSLGRVADRVGAIVVGRLSGGE